MNSTSAILGVEMDANSNLINLGTIDSKGLRSNFIEDSPFVCAHFNASASPKRSCNRLQMDAKYRNPSAGRLSLERSLGHTI